MLTPIEFTLVAGAVLGAGALVALLWPEWIVDYPRTVLAILAGITLAFGAAMVTLHPLGFRIGIDASSEPLLPENDPGEPVYQKAILDFGDDDIYVIAMEADDVFTHENLATLRGVSDEIRKLPGVRGTESLVDVYSYRWNAATQIVEMGRFIDVVPTDPAAIAELRKRALADPIYTRTILAKDARAAAINVTFKSLSDDEFVKFDLDDRIAHILESYARPGIRFHVTGRPHVRAQAHVLLVHDLVRLVPIAVLVSVIALWLMTGSLRGTLVPLLFNLMCVFWSYGAMAVIGANMNLITLVMGPALITIGGVTVVHCYTCYQEFAEKSKSGREAGLRTLKYTAEVVLISGLTTMVGFGALFINFIPATNELGGYCIFGVAAITVIVLTGLPALLSLLPLHAHTGKALFEPQTQLAEAFHRVIARHLERLANWEIRRRTLVLTSWTALGVVACALMPRIVTDTDFITFFRKSSAVRVDFESVNRLLTGAVPIYVVLSGSKEGTFREPAALRTVERLEDRISKLPGVTAVLSAVDLVKVAKQALEEGDPAQARVPDTRAEVAELMFMIPKEKLRAFATSNHSSANLLVRSDRLGSAALRELEDAIHAELDREKLPEGVTGDVTGNAIRINRGADGIAGNQVAQFTLTTVLCLGIVIAVFRSLGLGILAMPTNLLPVFFFYGALGAGVAPLSIPISLIGSIALGITVDDTSHYLQAFRHRRAEGIPAEQGVVACTMEVCRAMVVTSTMQITGFLVMTVSSFATLQQFGYLTAITMTLCLATDVLMLPALVVRFQKLVQPRPAQIAAAELERRSSDAA
ncbi:MAG TPA: MMPL family transporter [Myxococcota bacterium]|nr:MMPL family transporter [Myxococcota bacterium]